MRRFILPLLAAFLLAACGHSNNYLVEGVIEGNPTMNLRVITYADGNITQAVVASRDGKFNFSGTAQRGALIEIYDNDYRIIARTYAENGNNIELKLKRNSPSSIQAKGNEVAQRWASWLNENKELMDGRNAKAKNSAIAAYVGAHKSDPVATLLLVSEYDANIDAQGADSLLSLITPEARLSDVSAALSVQLERISTMVTREPIASVPYREMGNRTKIFNPHRSQLSLMAFSDDMSGRRDSILEQLRHIALHRSAGRFDMVDFSVDSDTLVWKRSIVTDSATWTQGWVAGSISGQALAKLGIPTVPYFIVVDSAGRQVWRGQSISEARSYIVTKLSKM